VALKGHAAPHEGAKLWHQVWSELNAIRGRVRVFWMRFRRLFGIGSTNWFGNSISLTFPGPQHNVEGIAGAHRGIRCSGMFGNSSSITEKKRRAWDSNPGGQRKPQKNYF
jgi:hypothetical protein